MTPTSPPQGKPAIDRGAEAQRVWRWREAICSDADLTPAVKVIGVRLSFHYDYTRHHVWTPQDQLAQECAMHPNTVQRARRLLVDRGALVVLTAPQRNRAARYDLGDPNNWHTPPSAPTQQIGTPVEVSQSDNGAPRPTEWGTSGDAMAHTPRCASSTRTSPERERVRGTTGVDPTEADASSAAPYVSPYLTSPAVVQR